MHSDLPSSKKLAGNDNKAIGTKILSKILTRNIVCCNFIEAIY